MHRWLIPLQNRYQDIENVVSRNADKLQQVLNIIEECENFYLRKIKAVIFFFLHGGQRRVTQFVQDAKRFIFAKF